MSLNTIQETERAIGALTPREIEELYAWLEQHCPPPIDTRVQFDLAAGRLDTAIQRALRHHRFLAAIPCPLAGRTRRADKQFLLLKANSQHPSLQFIKSGRAPRSGNVFRPHHVEPSRPCHQTGRW